MSAGPTRLEAAARTGTPAVIAPGCLDMVNFWEPETLPEKYRGRRLYQHNAKQTLIRTDPDENTELGRIIAGKLNLSTGPVAVYFPLAASRSSRRRAARTTGRKPTPRCSIRCEPTCGRTSRCT